LLSWPLDDVAVAALPATAGRRMIALMSLFRAMLRHAMLGALVGSAAVCGAAPTTNPAPATQADADDSASLPPIRQCFAQLSDADPDVRDQAMDQLMGLSRDDLPLLQQVVQEAAPLPPAQIEALRKIVNQVYLSADKYPANQRLGFLGIRTGITNLTAVDPGAENSAARGIVVLKRIPGFCGARFFRDGDIIIGIDEAPGVTFAEPDSFVQAIRDAGPGSTLHLQVLRGGTVRPVAVSLDSRPTEADFDPDLASLVQRRRQDFDAYWEKTFAPLLKEQVSGL
jgi:hypothetical protein